MFSAWIGVVLLFAFFGLLVLVVIGASPRGNSYEKKRARIRAEKLQALQEEKLTALTTYAWIDKSKGVARIPISEAMRITVAELAQKTPAPANPIATPPGANPLPQSAGPTTGSPAPSSTASTGGTPKPTSITGPNSEGRNQPAAALNPPTAPPGTQPGASNAPAASPPSAAVRAPASSSASPSLFAPATPLPVRKKTP